MFIYCADPLHPRQPDTAYTEEAVAAEQLCLSTALVSFETLVNAHDPVGAVRRIAERQAAGLAIYRGWMLRTEHYAQLYQALASRGVTLINSPAAYQLCHELPASYEAIADVTPRTVWLPFTGGDPPMDEIMALLRPFGSTPVLLKDYVKSRKHEWAEACFISAADDAQAVERVVRRFLELQGEDLQGGLVFREYIELRSAGVHPQSGMPLAQEFRIFWLDDEPLITVRYWESGEYDVQPPPIEQFRAIAARIGSRFYTMDVAQRADGEWVVIELGDGQVAGLPETADISAFYAGLTDALPSASNG